MISIIIPTYNRVELLRETLSAIQAQSHADWECLVVDDGSTDNTRDMVLEFGNSDPRIKWLERPETMPKGANSCRNYGFEQSKGDFINWFDSDDLMRADHYELKMNALRKHPEACCAIAQLVFFHAGDAPGVFSEAKEMHSQRLVEHYVMGEVSIGTTNPLWRREILEAQVSLFDTGIAQSQDLELYSRIFEGNREVAIVNEPLIMVRKDGETISGKLMRGDKRMLDSYVEVRRRILHLDYPEDVKMGLIRQLMYIFRLALGKKKYSVCDSCLSVVKKYLRSYPAKVQWKLFRIDLSYQLIRTIGFGETRFKSLLHF